ncbi:carboxypeptidase-like regulatory domain-containing protein [Sungkyunkwania multivorans]|uniref:Carboxypeptidase-like regulatory domain-containing protein n=1 Tax=Sungkyunkwania multivorans TaxID=1173618 RepID=A0ABW3CW63_9FLAO
MKFIMLVLSFIVSHYTLAQVVVSGKVTDSKGNPIGGANVYLKGTYDGASTSETGTFNFSTTEQGVHTLTVTYISFEEFSLTTDVAQLQDLTIVLREEINTLTGVTLTAGSFKAGDNAKVSVLKPLDIVTTASALGDYVGAFQTLPGTTTVAEDGRLFVRGGQAEETQVFIDGMRVFTPFTPTANNIPTRGRYSPFLFKGITFSTGGYSAEYGQALSSVLLLNTIDEPDQEKTDIALMSVGGGLGHTTKWEKSALSVNTSYINLAPYIAIYPDRNDWEKPIEVAAGETVFRRKFDKGMFKLYAALDMTNFRLTQPDINLTEGARFGLKNRNFYINSSYKGYFGNDWILNTGLSYTNDRNGVTIQDAEVDGDTDSFHLKASFKKSFSSRLKLNFGTEYFNAAFEEDFMDASLNFSTAFSNNIFASFVEGDIFFSNKLACKIGLRSEYSELLRETNWSPRLSLAYKTGDASQFSLAYGEFYQQPLDRYLKFQRDLHAERATHYLLNYQYSKGGQIFRAEAYHKRYRNLIKYDTMLPQFDSDFNNEGFGDASGLDLFWRDNRSIKNLDYWLSYSYLDTKRNYQNFPVEAAPSFTNKHNISLVGKYWIDSWKSQIGASYIFATGRPYTDPNITSFLSERTRPYNSLSINWAYLISQQKILYFSVNNVLATRNVFGYNYANTPNSEGFFDRQAIRPAADQFFFIGFFWTISGDKKSNQLDNL